MVGLTVLPVRVVTMCDTRGITSSSSSSNSSSSSSSDMLNRLSLFDADLVTTLPRPLPDHHIVSSAAIYS